MAPESSPTPTVPRRHLLVAAGGVLGGLAIGIPGRGESALFPTRLRPPGVPDGDETNFMSACIRCGECVDVCPTSVLHLGFRPPAVDPGPPCPQRSKPEPVVMLKISAERTDQSPIK